MGGGLRGKMTGLEAASASGLLYSKRFAVLLKLVASCCDCENDGNQA